MKVLIYLLVISIIFQTCGFNYQKAERNISENKKVYINKIGNNYNLIRNGQTFYIKGAVGHVKLDLFKEAGGNTINIYHQYLNEDILNQADSLGLAIVITLDIERPLNDADYTDQTFCTNQRAWVKEIVNQYKDYPGLIYWIIGNEIHLSRYIIPEIWKEVNELSKIIHQLDPQHLTTTNIGAMDRKQIMQIKLFTDDIDFISINAHHKNYLVRREIRNLIWGWDGPYVISEWTGPLYWHDVKTTDWGAVIEPNSTKKTNYYNHSYYIAMKSDPTKCLGGFVFYWGEKQERTHTWFSLIPENKYSTQPIEVLYYNWKKGNIKNFSPRINKIFFENKENEIDLYFRQNSKQKILIDVIDPEFDPISIRVDLYEEANYYGKMGGNNEYKPPLLFSDSLDNVSSFYELNIPNEEGAYRVFLNFFDDKKNVAIQNIPFYVVPI